MACGLSCKVEEKELVIRIPLSLLAFAFEESQYNNPFIEDEERSCFNTFVRKYKVTDQKEFAKDVIAEMLREEEDGATPLFEFLDKMLQNAVGNGTIGITKDGRTYDGELKT